MENRRILDLDLSDKMCLPYCSNRVYKSSFAHAGLVTSATISAACFLVTIGTLIEKQFDPGYDEYMNDLLGNILLGLIVTTAVSAFSTSSFFFFGTKKIPAPEESPIPNESDALETNRIPKL
jgi:hypothetical protein